MRVRKRFSIGFVMFLVFISTISYCVNLPIINTERNATRPAQEHHDKSAIIAAEPLSSHEPILITGDDQLVAFFQGNSSNGSAANPFILENLSINASSAVHGIEIKDTSLNIHIRSNAIVQASNPAHSSKLPSGIMLNNVTHVVISNNTIEQNYLGISITDSSNVSIINNVIANNQFIGVGLNFSSSITLWNNNFHNCGLHVLGTLPDCTSINIDESNKINEIGRLYYFKSLKNTLLPAFPDGSQIILVNCSGLLLRGVKSFSSSIGIMLLYTNNSIIQDCVISNQNYHGIVCAGSNNNSIENNKLLGSYYSLGALYCNGCHFVGNQVFDAIFDGLVLLFCEDTIVAKNTFVGNVEYGIKVANSRRVDIQANIVMDSEVGIGIAWDNERVTISKNVISHCSQYGLRVDLSNDVTVCCNNIDSCDIALRIAQMMGGTIVFLNNFINSTTSHVDLFMLSPANWNTTLWGNYWDDYILVNPTSSKTERGTWIIPYIVVVGDANVTDHHALTSPNTIPRASFLIETRNVHVNDPVRLVFTGDPGDASTTFTWDFGDGTSIMTNDLKTSHVYKSPGEYRILLIITDKHGEQDSAILLVHVDSRVIVDILPSLLGIILVFCAIFLLIEKKKNRFSDFTS